MPNWVFNYVRIEGSELDIARVKKQLNTPYTQTYKDHATKDGKLVEVYKEATHNKPIFSFWNIIKPDDMNAYLNEESTGIPKDGEEWFQSNNWYDWNIRNWGTKWDVAVEDFEEYPETQILDENNEMVIYKFDTAWAPPVMAIKELSRQHPNLVIKLEYEEETGWGGEIEFRGGAHTQTNQYEFRCECGEEYKEEPELDDDGQCPECAKEEVSG